MAQFKPLVRLTPGRARTATKMMTASAKSDPVSPAPNDCSSLPSMKYFIECTNTYGSESNSGIQRVVRSIVGAAVTIKGDPQMVPVIYGGHHFYSIEGRIRYPESVINTGSVPAQRVASVKGALRKVLQGVRRLLVTVAPFPAVVRFAYTPPTQWGLSRIVMLPLAWKRSGRALVGPARAPVVIGSDDVLVLLDSSWHTTLWNTVDQYRQQGTTVVVVIYDLIPLTHPQFCVPTVVASFTAWIKQAIPRADVVIAISNTIAIELQGVMDTLAVGNDRVPALTYFWLGSDLDGESVSTKVLDLELAQVCRSTIPSYAYVGTIEPRKNHFYALQAFDALWARGIAANFLIIGRIGWHCEDFVRQVKAHPAYGQHLFMFNDVEDNELAHVYDTVRGLIFTSVAEGFGLPIVEGLKRGLPVFASDIPVFREIGQEGVVFVDLDQPDSLADALASHIAQGAHRLGAPIEWMTWRQSALQLQERIAQCLADRSKTMRTAAHDR